MHYTVIREYLICFWIDSKKQLITDWVYVVRIRQDNQDALTFYEIWLVRIFLFKRGHFL